MFAVHQEGGHHLHPGVLLPHRPELGQPRLFPASADRSLEAAEVLGAFIAQFYDDKPSPRLILLSHDDRGARRCSPRRCRTKSGRKVEVAVPQRGEKKDLVEHALANAREALGRKLAETSSQQQLLDGARRDLRPAAAAAPHRGLRQQPHHGHQRGRRHDRRGPGGLSQEPVPQVQHPLDRPHAGRRLRHDARGADAPLHAAAGGSAARLRVTLRPRGRGRRAQARSGERVRASARREPAPASRSRAVTGRAAPAALSRGRRAELRRRRARRDTPTPPGPTSC